MRADSGTIALLILSSAVAGAMGAAVMSCGEPEVDHPDGGVVTGKDGSVMPLPDAMVLPSCEPPEMLCGTGCVNVTSDALHCGGCNQPCAAGTFCATSTCTLACGPGLTPCGASCVDQATNRQHCGMCNRACDADRDCRGGDCACPEGYSECDGRCVNPEMDRMHCGICRRACEPDEICSMSDCVCAGGSRESACNDGVDNDCDDRIDCMDPDCAGETRQCSGRCGMGTETCQATGSWGPCEGGNGEPEICGDGIDQDCNGTDERRPDPYEPNDTCDTCTLLSMMTDPEVVVTQARFDSIMDPVDCFKFMADDGIGYPEHILITLDNVPAGHDYDLYLYSSVEACRASMPLVQSDAAGNASEMIDYSESFGSSEDGTYYIRVVRFRGQSCTMNYRLSVSGLR